MYMLRRALFAGFRIAFFGALKLALYAYILTLPDTALAGAASKHDGRNGGIAPYAAQEGTGQAGASSRRSNDFGILPPRRRGSYSG